MNEMMTEGRLLVSENKLLKDKLSEHHQASSQKEFDLHQRSGLYEKNVSEHQSAARLMDEELRHKQRQTEMMHSEYREVEDKLRQSRETISDNDRAANIHLGELQETISGLQRGDEGSTDT